MRRKHFYVVAYDISDEKRRAKVVKVMETIGARVNYSVFDCFLTPIQYNNVYEQLSQIIMPKEDRVNIYPICAECYARIRYIPEKPPKKPKKIAVV